MLIRQIVTYGAECWVLTKDKLQLAVFERKVLRKIFGPIRDTDQWKRRYNEELYQLYIEPNTVKWIKSVRLRWARHIVHMRESDPPVGNQHLTCFWVKEWWEDPREDGVRKWRGN
jgi:hypothetical protein